MIYAEVGRLGHGKSMRMVVRGLALGKLRGAMEDPPRCWIASNIRVNAPDGVVVRQLPMDGFSEALSALMAEALAARMGLVVLVDEIDEVWGAADWQNMRKSDRHRIKQSRHYGCDVIYTAQFMDQVEKSIRNMTEEAELLQAFPAPTIARREAGKRPWFFRAERFRPAAVREIVGPVDKDKRLGRSFYRYRRAHEGLYDTDQIIVPVDAEALCARHKKERAEERCPVCNPARQNVRPALSVLVAEAEASRPEGNGSRPR